MRVALDISILQAPRTGIGEYALQLARALRQQPGLELALFDGMSWRAELPSAPRPGYGKLSKLAKGILPDAYRLRRTLMQHRFDRGANQLQPGVYHQPSLWPLQFDGPMVMTLHDLAHIHYPDTQPRDRLREIERQLPDALQRANYIMVDSQFIAEEVTQHYGIPADKLRVAPLGYAARFRPRSEAQLRARLAAHQLRMHSYYLCLGTREPRKNLDLVIAAYMGLPDSTRQRMPLLIIGANGWRHDQLKPIPDKALSQGQIRLLGYQDEDCVAELLAGAHALLFPSRYEGFGLPVLEAMASGTPVIASSCSALPEVADQAALYMHPDDVEGCRNRMLELQGDSALQTTLRKKGLRRASEFSWERCAHITADTYQAAGNF